MTLAEKIAALRGERRLSQGDLAERLDVSRQSVSKWETGQAVPELDKIIRLADLFEITVDELVRDGEAPGPEVRKPAAPEPEMPPAAEPRIIYVERPWGLTPIQILGVICAVIGAVIIILALAGGDPELIILGLAIVILSLPLLLGKKHPFLISGWITWAVGYAFLCTPYLMGPMGAWQPFTGVVQSFLWMLRDGRMGGSILLMILFFLAAYLLLSVLTVVLPVYTFRLCRKKWKGRKRPEGELSAE